MASYQTPDLAAHHRKMLQEESGIADAILTTRGYYTETVKAKLIRLGFSQSQAHVPSLVIPIWDVRGEVTLYQARPDTPRIKNGKTLKYETPSGATMVLDVPPTLRHQLDDPTIPLWITEGIKKADALASHDCCTIALLGVWNWRGTNAHGGKTALPDWENVALNGRTIYIVFDSDVMTNPAVHQAMSRLKVFLESRHARVALIYLPPAVGGSKQGVDDFLVTGHNIKELIAFATSELRQLESDESHVPYKSTTKGLIWLKDTRDGSVSIPLTNFTAEIVEDVLIDDGAEQWRTFKIHTVMGEHHTTCEVPALRFSLMQWPTEHLGAEALLYPGQTIREHARAAIQCLSTNVVKRNVYGHLGWRRLEEEDKWCYLHAVGAIGQHGQIDGVAVQINNALSCYVLADPAIKGLVSAVQTSLKFLTLAPHITTIPLYGTIWRAVLTEGDFSLHVVGPTGEGKTALAALLQQHFGPQMDARHLPANWTSTANSLEAVAFEAKDCLLVVDEFTPTDSAHANTIQRTAERLLRAQANRTGRGRLRSDATYRPAKPPRGLILSTGEDLPKGQSLRARMLIVEVEPQSVDFKALTQCQQDADSGLYAQALYGFIKWLAPRYDTIHQQWHEELAEIRYFAAQSGMHRRTPENIASLALGWRYFLLFAVDAGVFTITEAKTHWSNVWETLGQVALAQGQYQAGAEPTRRFLELLCNAIASGKACLKPIRSCDYRDSEMSGTCIGWIDDDNDRIYLLPDVSYAVAQELGKAIGDPVVIAPQTLRKRLKEKGHIAETPSSRGTTTVRKTINKKRIEVLALYKASLVTEVDQLDQSNHLPENEGHWSSSYPPLVRDWTENPSQSDHEKLLNRNNLEIFGQVGQKSLTEQTPNNATQPINDQVLSDDNQNLTTKPDQEAPDEPRPIHSTMVCPRCQAQRWVMRDGYRSCMNCQYRDASEVDDDVVPEEVF